MKTPVFEQWCDRHEIPTVTRDFLAPLRASPPTRRVQGRLFNVCGPFASRKMGVSIQFESHTVELVERQIAKRKQPQERITEDFEPEITFTDETDFSTD